MAEVQNDVAVSWMQYVYLFICTWKELAVVSQAATKLSDFKNFEKAVIHLTISFNFDNVHHDTRGGRWKKINFLCW